MIPSEKFPKNKLERKLLITKYKQELANTGCRKLRETYYKFCPYGDNCKLLLIIIIIIIIIIIEKVHVCLLRKLYNIIKNIL